MRENIMPLISRWLSVRAWAALHCEYYNAVNELAAYTACIHGDADELRRITKLVADDAGFPLDRVKYSKPRTKNPANEIGTRAHAIAAYEILAAKCYHPMSYA